MVWFCACTGACTGRAVVQDGNGDETVATSAHDDDASATVASGDGLDSGEANTIDAPDVGVAPPTVTELCPPVAAAQVGIDSGVRVMFSSPSDPVVAIADPIALVCDGQPVAGSIDIAPKQIVFRPTTTLPMHVRCEVALVDGAVTIDDEPIAAVSWEFETGAASGAEFDFYDPVTLGLGTTLDGAAIAAVGNRVAMILLTPALTLALSTDHGGHFDTLEIMPFEGTVQMPDLDASTGGVHLVWQVLDGVNDGQCYYVRWDSESGILDDPYHLQAVDHPMYSTYPSVTTDGSRTVVVTWQEECNGLDPCAEDDPGVYMRVSDDRGANFDRPTRLVQPAAWGLGFMVGPRLEWVSGGLAGIWVAYPNGIPEGIDVMDGGDVLERAPRFDLLHHIDGYALDAEIDRMDDGDGALVWIDGSIAGSAATKLARLRDRHGEGLDPPVVLAEQIGLGNYNSSVAVEGENVAVVAIEFPDEGPLSRRLMVSDDAGQTMSAPQWLDTLLADEDGATPSDSAFPSVATSGNRTHLVWWRRENDEPSVRYTRGDRIPPCGVKPVN